MDFMVQVSVMTYFDISLQLTAQLNQYGILVRNQHIDGVFFGLEFIAHTIHGTGIYLHLVVFNGKIS